LVQNQREAYTTTGKEIKYDMGWGAENKKDEKVRRCGKISLCWSGSEKAVSTQLQTKKVSGPGGDPIPATNKGERLSSRQEK